MLFYRISRWTPPGAVGAAGAGLRGRRALTAMSVRWVSRDWLLQQTDLGTRDIDALLDTLHDAGVLEISDAVEPAALAGGGERRALWRGLWQIVRERARHVLPIGGRAPDRPAVLRGLPHFDVRLIAAELSALLDSSPAMRHVLIDLARLESALRTRGPAAVDALPERTLRWALGQLHSLGPRGAQGCLLTLQERLEAAYPPRTADDKGRQDLQTIRYSGAPTLPS